MMPNGTRHERAQKSTCPVHVTTETQRTLCLRGDMNRTRAFCGSLLFGHERISIVGRRHEVFLDGAGTNPTQQVYHRAGFVVGSAGARSVKRLLAHDGACRLVVNIEITGSKPKNTVSVGDSLPVGGEDAPGQTIRRGLVDY